MKLANGVEVLELPMQSFVGRRIIHPTLIWDDNTIYISVIDVVPPFFYNPLGRNF